MSVHACASASVPVFVDRCLCLFVLFSVIWYCVRVVVLLCASVCLCFECVFFGRSCVLVCVIGGGGGGNENAIEGVFHGASSFDGS